MTTREKAETVANDWFGSDVFRRGGAYRKGLADSVERVLLETIKEVESQYVEVVATAKKWTDFKNDPGPWTGMIDRIAALEKENFKLAAGQCPNAVGSEGGTAVCKLESDNKLYREALQKIAAYKVKSHVYGGFDGCTVDLGTFPDKLCSIASEALDLITKAEWK